MIEPNENIARTLFKEGAVLIDTAVGFKLKLHETNPNAPLSPIKFNLRPPGVKGGMMTPALFQCIGFELARIAIGHPKAPSILVGVPNAGELLVDNMQEMASCLTKKARHFARLKLAKTEGMGHRRINGIQDFVGKFPGGKRNVAWLIDDLITQADSKLEALDMVRAASFLVPVCLVVIDREQGGKRQMQLQKVELISLFTMSWLIEFYRSEGSIDGKQADDIRKYIKKAA